MSIKDEDRKPIGFVAKQVGASAVVIEKHYWKGIAKKDDLNMPPGAVAAPRIDEVGVEKLACGESKGKTGS